MEEEVGAVCCCCCDPSSAPPLAVSSRQLHSVAVAVHTGQTHSSSSRWTFTRAPIHSTAADRQAPATAEC